MRSSRSIRRVPGALALLLAVTCVRTADAEIRSVRAGQDLQAVLNAAAPGDVIVLQPGAEFVGNFVLPVKAGDAPIVLRSAGSSDLPPEGGRIRPSHAPLLAKLRSPSAAPAIKTAPAAHHWELRYLEFGPNQHGYGDIVQIGDGSKAQNTLARVPHHFVLSHLYVRGDERFGQKRGISLNAAHVTIRDSHIEQIKAAGQDSQAIGGWNGPGPYLIENNYLEAAGENVLFGGADPAIQDLVADSITVRGNYFSRPLAWRQPILAAPQHVAAGGGAGGSLPAGTYAYRVEARGPVGQGTIGRSPATAEVVAAVPADGGAVRITWSPVADATEYRVYGRSPNDVTMFWSVTATAFVDAGAPGSAGAAPDGKGTVWSVKNLFELKNARNVTIRNNVFEHHWKESQAGYAIVLTPRNSNGACTWCIVEHVTFENNVVRRVAAGVNLLGFDIPSRPTRQTRGIVIRNNLFHDMGSAYGGNGWFLLIGDEPRDVVVDHNTVSHTGNAVVFAYGGTESAPRQILNFRFTNNAARHGAYGINGGYFGFGNGVIQAFFPASVVTGNYLAGGPASRYPSGNRTAGQFEAEFEDADGGDFRLRAGSQLRGAATDGGDIGADGAALRAMIPGIETGGPAPPVPRPRPPGNIRVTAP